MRIGPLSVGYHPKDRLGAGTEVSANIIGFSTPDHAPKRLYVHCQDGSVWRLYWCWRFLVAVRVAS